MKPMDCQCRDVSGQWSPSAFALCMSVLLMSILLILYSPRFRTISGPHLPCNYLDYQWLSVGHRCFFAVFFFFGRDYRLSESVSVRHRSVLYHFTDLCLVRSFWTLTIARIFQGFSASAITSVNTAQLRYVYPKSQIGRGMGINAMVVAISAAAGPSVASGILSIASWHWLFAINVPLGITALLLGIKHLPRQEERTKRKFDFVSAIANAITFGLLIYTLDGFAHHEEMDFLVLQLIILAIVGTFYVRRQLTQTTPLLPLDLLRIPIFRLSILTSICSFIAQMAAMVSLPFFLQNTLGHSEVMTGLLLTPWPLATLVTAPLAGYLVERIHPGILGSIGHGIICRRTLLALGAYRRVVRYQYYSSSDALRSGLRTVSDSQ